MESFKRHLPKDRVVVPRQQNKPEKSQHKETGENEDAIDQAFFGGKVHENCRHQPSLERRYQHGHGDVRLARTKIDIRQRHCDSGKYEQRDTDHNIAHHMLMHAVRVFLVFFWVLRDVGRVVHSLEQIKQWKYKYPDQIDKVPEKAAHLDTISQMLRVALVKFFADRQPHVNEDEHAAQHVQ